jgi:uncharacterized protein YkwD
MRKARLHAAFAAVFMALFACSSMPMFAQQSAQKLDDRTLEQVQEIVALTNRERAKACVAPVKLNESLSAAAAAHARDMADKRYFDHRSPKGEGPDQRCRKAGYPDWTGENIFMGPASAKEAVEGWMASAGHKKNILNGESQEIGVGVARAANGTTYWVQVFGAREDILPIVVEDEAISTTSTTVKLFLYGQGKAVKARFSNDGSTFSAWEPFRSRREWSLTPGEGIRTVTVELSDAEGNVFRSSDSIVLRVVQRAALAR